MTEKQIENTGVIKEIKNKKLDFNQKVSAIEAAKRIIRKTGDTPGGTDFDSISGFCVWASTQEGHVYWFAIECTPNERRYK
jgi:hypothetical protein